MQNVQRQASWGGSKLRGAVEELGEPRGAVAGFVERPGSGSVLGGELHAVSQGGRGILTAHDFVRAGPVVYI